MEEVVLYDIFPNVSIPDNSFIEFVSFLSIGAFFIGVFLYHYHDRKKSQNKDAHYRKILEDLDWDEGRVSAYRLEFYGKLCLKNRRQKQMLRTIMIALDTQKYDPNPPKITQEVNRLIEQFIRSLGTKDA